MIDRSSSSKTTLCKYQILYTSRQDMNQTSTQAKKINPLRTPLPIEEQQHLNLLRPFINPFILTPDLISRVTLIHFLLNSLCHLSALPSILFPLNSTTPRNTFYGKKFHENSSIDFAISFYLSTLSNSHSPHLPIGILLTAS